MKTQDVINHFGSERETIYQLDITPQTLRNWKDLGTIPNQSQPMVQILTDGKFEWERPGGATKADKVQAGKKRSIK